MIRNRRRGDATTVALATVERRLGEAGLQARLASLDGLGCQCLRREW